MELFTLLHTQNDESVSFDFLGSHLSWMIYICSSDIISVDEKENYWEIRSNVLSGISRLTHYLNLQSFYHVDALNVRDVYRQLLQEIKEYVCCGEGDASTRFFIPMLSQDSFDLLQYSIQSSSKNVSLQPAEDAFDNLSNDMFQSVMQDQKFIYHTYSNDSYVSIQNTYIPSGTHVSPEVCFLYQVRTYETVQLLQKLNHTFQQIISDRLSLFTLIHTLVSSDPLPITQSSEQSLDSSQRKRIRTIERWRQKSLSKIKLSNDIEQYGDSEQAVLCPQKDGETLGVVGLALEPFLVTILVPEGLQLHQRTEIYTKEQYHHYLNMYGEKTRKLMIVVIHNLIRKTCIGDQLVVEFDRQLFRSWPLELLVEPHKSSHNARGIVQNWLPKLQNQELLECLEYLFPWDTPIRVKNQVQDQRVLWYYIFSCLVWYQFGYPMIHLYTESLDEDINMTEIHSVLRGVADEERLLKYNILSEEDTFNIFQHRMESFFESQSKADKSAFDSLLTKKF